MTVRRAVGKRDTERSVAWTKFTHVGRITALALLLGCGGNTSSGADGGSGGHQSAHDLCVTALASTGSCIAATGSTQADCEAEAMDAIAAGCRAELEASLACLESATPDPVGACPACEAQGRATSACLTR